MHAVIKFMHQFDTNDPPALNFLPEPPTNPRAIADSNGHIALGWSAPVILGGSQNPTNYIIYRSTNGYGFGNPIFTGNVTSYTISNLTAGVDYYFRVSASNPGGESMPSEVVGCQAPITNGAPRVLVVNGFDRFDRTTNLRHNVVAGTWDQPGNTGDIERVFPRWINGFDYVVQHGKAIANYGLPFGPAQESPEAALRAAARLMKEGGADMIKVDAAADFPDAVRALVRAGIPVFAQFGLTPQTAAKHGIPYSAQNSPGAQASAEAAAKLVEEARLLEDAGAAMLDFTNSGPVAGAAVVKAVSIPVIGGFGGGPWLDGRIRLAITAIGYGEKWLDPKTETYTNTAKAALEAFSALIADARAGRQIKG